MGRPTILDEGKRREICAILAVGCSRETAARYVGCHRTTISRTADREEEFAQALLQAESRHEILHLTNINRAATETRYWRAAAWALERKYPARYAARDPHTLTTEQVSQLLAQFADVLMQEVSQEDERQQILARLAELTADFQKDDEADA
jgi:IS30 family transposase